VWDKLNFVPLILEMGPQISFIIHFFGLLSFPFIKNWYLPLERSVMNYDATSLSELPFFFSFLIYLSMCYTIIRLGKHNQDLSAFKLKDFKWLRILIVALIPIVIIWLIAIILNHSPLPKYFYLNGYRYLTVLLAIGYVYWLGMAAYARQAKCPSMI